MFIFFFFFLTLFFNIKIQEKRTRRAEHHWSSKFDGTWQDVIEEEKTSNLEAWCREFSLDHLPNVEDKRNKTNKWSWIKKHLSRYFSRTEVDATQIISTEWQSYGTDALGFHLWLNRQSVATQWRLYWPYLRLLDRSLHFKHKGVVSGLDRLQWDNYQRPNLYLKLYLESNPYCCLLYKQYKEFKLYFTSHVDKTGDNVCNAMLYRSVLASLLVLLLRTTFLTFEFSVLASLIVNLEPGNQSMHLFEKRQPDDQTERRREYWHVDWNLVQALVSLVLDCRSHNPLMQLEQICKHQLYCANQLQHDADSRIMALELDFDLGYMTVWNSNKTMIKWHWLDWHFKNVQWLVYLFQKQ